MEICFLPCYIRTYLIASICLLASKASTSRHVISCPMFHLKSVLRHSLLWSQKELPSVGLTKSFLWWKLSGFSVLSGCLWLLGWRTALPSVTPAFLLSYSLPPAAFWTSSCYLGHLASPRASVLYKLFPLAKMPFTLLLSTQIHFLA